MYVILFMKGGETQMKKFFVLAIVVVVTLAMTVTAFAVPSGKTVEFDGKGAGKVVFTGKVHADKGLKCADCHQSGLFKMKKGADAITMNDINAGKFCGHCHNGSKAFSAKDAANCSKCHKK
jgi:c(7)-type cytochrome triheme protein